MKLSTRGRYGTRLMLEPPSRYKEGPVLLIDVSLYQNISLKYLDS
jgi:DNA-binding IscR family transcriptional regulator